MKNDLISIIVTAYNVEKYVSRTIDSLLNQTYSLIEIICVDDGSSDNTYSILQNYAKKDSRVKAYTKTNEGVTKARKFGFEKANGEYIGFTDADDIVDADMFQRLYDNLINYCADISHCGYVVDNLNGTKEYFYNTGCLAQQDKKSGVESLISGSFEPGLCNKLYKYDLLHNLFQNDIMDYSIKMNEDVLMNYFLFKEANSSVIEDVCLYHYVKREGSATVSGFNKDYSLDKIKVKQIIRDDSLGTCWESTAKRAFIVKCLNIYNVFLDENNPELKDELSAIIKLIKDNKADFKHLNLKYRLLAKLLLISKGLYYLLYKLMT